MGRNPLNGQKNQFYSEKVPSNKHCTQQFNLNFQEIEHISKIEANDSTDLFKLAVSPKKSVHSDLMTLANRKRNR